MSYTHEIRGLRPNQCKPTPLTPTNRANNACCEVEWRAFDVIWPSVYRAHTHTHQRQKKYYFCYMFGGVPVPVDMRWK